jgi:hypothetical protein
LGCLHSYLLKCSFKIKTCFSLFGLGAIKVATLTKKGGCAAFGGQSQPIIYFVVFGFVSWFMYIYFFIAFGDNGCFLVTPPRLASG